MAPRLFLVVLFMNLYKQVCLRLVTMIQLAWSIWPLEFNLITFLTQETICLET
jgi:hypothetical protein